MTAREQARSGWVAWLETYGAGAFFDAFMEHAQGAQGWCVHCRKAIYLDIAEGGGVPDWSDGAGDYGCPASPDTDDDGTGGHFPRRVADNAPMMFA